MSYGPYRYQNGNKYVFGSDGRWWIVTNSYGGDDYGYPVGGHTHHGHHPRHHAFAPSALPTHSHSHHQTHFPSRRVGAAGPEDPWRGNTYARELFQGRGAATFIGADHLVTTMTEVYAVAYTAAFFAPEILAVTAPVVRVAIRPGVTVAARLYGTYLATATGGAIAVLGRYPEYIDDAQTLGANVFSMSMRTYNFFDWFGETWTANQAFIDRVIATGQQIYLATPPLGQEGSIFQEELFYLRGVGVDPFLWQMVKR